MQFRSHAAHEASAIVDLFVAVFTKSEGEAEGEMVGTLARDLMADTDPRDLFGFVAIDDGHIVGSIFFSRLSFEQPIEAFILSPVAVHTDHQGRGVGQGLITHGISGMRHKGVQFITTYGSPNYYRKVGFSPLPPDVIVPPFELSQPIGWLGQSLTSEPIKPIPGRCSCVKALSDPAYW